MSAESVKGSEGDNLTSSSDAQNGPKQDVSESPDKTRRATSDSEGEGKIKADSEEVEKQRLSSAGSRSGSEKEADRSRSPGGRASRSSSGVRKSPGSSPRPKSSDSRPKSSSSGEVKFEGKSRKKKKKGGEVLLEGHQVTFTVTISVAIPTENYQKWLITSLMVQMDIIGLFFPENTCSKLLIIIKLQPDKPIGVEFAACKDLDNTLRCNKLRKNLSVHSV